MDNFHQKTVIIEIINNNSFFDLYLVELFKVFYSRFKELHIIVTR